MEPPVPDVLLQYERVIVPINYQQSVKILGRIEDKAKAAVEKLSQPHPARVGIIDLS
jgi:hypothetical protein